MLKRLFSLLLACVMLYPFPFGAEAEWTRSSISGEHCRTFCGTSVGGWLQAGGEREGTYFYSITEEPVRGDLELYEDGFFVYIPRNGKQGHDSFSYQVVNEESGISREHTVSIQIDRQASGLVYADMRGRPDGYAAVLLAEKGLFIGEKVAGRCCFSPGKAVTRGEFLSICMCISGKPVISAAASTGYMDDNVIPAWMKSYVSTAAMQGLEISRDGRFEADEAITMQEAASLSEQILGLRCPEELKTEQFLDRASMAVLLLDCLEK